MLGPNMLTKISARRIAGIEDLMSTSRWMTWSIQPPYHPDNNPKVVPIVADINKAVIDTNIAILEP